MLWRYLREEPSGVEGRASAKAPGWQFTWFAPGTLKRPESEKSEPEERLPVMSLEEVHAQSLLVLVMMVVGAGVGGGGTESV